MSIFKCKACGATYIHPQAYGVSYFHACAPVHNPAYDAQFTLDANGERVAKGKIDPKIPEMIEHPNKRDENVEVKPDGKVRPKNDGSGKDTL